jgi:bifunctional DNase/RNase
MIKVTVDSVKVSMLSQHRVVVLKEEEQDRYLPIWIGPFEADAITIGLQKVQMTRPLTHDLLSTIIDQMDASVSHIQVNDLRNDTFYAQIVVQQNGRTVEIDSRPSDAIALAVRVQAPIFAEEAVLDKAGVRLDQESLAEKAEDAERRTDVKPEELEKLSPFRDFIDSLDMDDFDKRTS